MALKAHLREAVLPLARLTIPSRVDLLALLRRKPRLIGRAGEPAAKRGMMGYAIDSCGASEKPCSVGPSMPEMSVATEATDLLLVIDRIRALPEVDENRVILLGQSRGGFISTIVADTRPDDVAALVLLYPALVIHDNMVGRFGNPEDVPEIYVDCALTVVPGADRSFCGLERAEITDAIARIVRIDV